MSLGLRNSGFNVLAAIEADKYAADAYSLNHPATLLVTCDIRRVPASRIMGILGMSPGDLDLLAACPPCQSFSRMRKKNRRRVSSDGDNTLILDCLRFIRTFRPKTIILENVPGLSTYWKFKSIVDKLHGMGYLTTHDIVNASSYAVPQRRKRLILLATRVKRPSLPAPSTTIVTVRKAFSAVRLSDRRTDFLHNYRSNRSKKIRDLIALIPKNGGSRKDLAKKYQLACHQRLDGFKDVYGRMSWDKVSPTITGSCCNPSKGRFLHPEKNRAISLREAAILQSFPISYKFCKKLDFSRTGVAQLIGNALPPKLARAQGEVLRDQLIGK